MAETLQHTLRKSLLVVVSSSARHGDANLLAEAADALDAKDAEIARLTNLCERLRMEAQCHAMDARAQTVTINEAYQVATGATGEPGNWRGSKPIKDAIDTAFNEGVDAVIHLGDVNAWFSDEDVAFIRQLKREDTP